jgi:CDP-glucose 4,6-dehydratase
MEDMVTHSQNWAGRRVFLTGHTGFKGGWLALWLKHLGAEVRGYALDPANIPNFMEAAGVAGALEDIRGDIRDAACLDKALLEFAPEVLFHLAAQPLVRLSYDDPILTYETNVIGTARVLDAVRRSSSVRAVVSVTTDKCYENKEWLWGYRETDTLGGYDPYSSSKACAELVSAAYRQSYFAKNKIALATARAGNVIGGGDWAVDRLIPDLVRGFQQGKPVSIRKPGAIRPWQHVLEPLRGYLTLAEKLLGDDASRYATAYNFGPSEDDARPVEWIADRMAEAWGDGAAWFQDGDPGMHEAGYLKLDASRARAELGWAPKLDLAQALDWSVRWYRAHSAGQDMATITTQQIRDYEALPWAK